ncbi:transglycosylase SLT domain-containing protein [Alkalihalobacillus oceani]|uniref:Transglycosylase SLT domain-containing protein n=1 Tax=Halalkalibacter oceani TaxID=1653776 RepID=A0A9X2DMU1_9BACI|nr:transglycosylase SLT domain-containing protein [Halalkalibacter oceani]MCM3712860.1 transglycosylase SLT domain-containing protein [Halalkalibacter oceani]
MKRIFLTSLIVILTITAGFFYVENRQLHHTISENELAYEELRTVQEMEQIQLYYLQQPRTEVPPANYDTWLRSKEVADQLYQDSEGKFKKEWGVFLGEMAQQRDIDPFLVYELLRTETGGTFDPTLVGPETRYGHAYGMAQFMKNTAPWIAEMAGLPYEDELLFDPLYSIELSVEYLSFLYHEYEDWDHALTAYHRGMYGLEKYLSENGHAESWYAVEIQEKADKFNWVAYVN